MLFYYKTYLFNLIFFTDPMDYFSLDGLTGDLSTAKSIDRESLFNNNGIISLTVRVNIQLLNNILFGMTSYTHF